MAGYDIIMSAGWEEPPFWFWVGQDYDHEISETAKLLALSEELVREITEWDDEFQAIFNRAVPQDSTWPSPEAEAAWLAKGRTLAARIKRESRLEVRVDCRGSGEITDGSCVF